MNATISSARESLIFTQVQIQRHNSPTTKSLIFILSLLTILSFGTNELNAQPPSHDPSTMIRDGSARYWIYTTGNGIWCMSSSNTNFTDWRAESTPFPIGTWPSWINSAVPGFAGTFWAPDIIYMDGYYYLYYSASTFGSSRSAIGVTRTTSLGNPNWTDQGMVVSSNGSSSAINAIDPGLFMDTDGRVWMTYGSWFGGIGIVEINPATGKTIGNVTQIAGGNHLDIEAPYIMKNGNYYYLFVNRGNCCQGVNSTYYVQVAGSTSVTGPYTNWRTFLSTQGRYIGPGHVGYGEGKLTYHYYDGLANGAARLMITTLGWSGGWPVAGGTTDDAEDDTGDDADTSNGTFNGTYSLIATHSGKALDVYNWGTSNGTNIVQWSSWGGDTQKFNITPVDGEWHRISPIIATSKAIDVNEISTADGANIQIWDYWGGNGQQFRFQEAASGTYNIIARNSNKCLNVYNASQSDGANVEQSTCISGSENQMFQVNASNGRLTAITPAGQPESAHEELIVYPNPTTDRLTIQIFKANKNMTRIEVYNSLGKLVFTGEFIGSEYEMDLGRFPKGVYFLKLKNNDAFMIKKIQKQ